MEGGIIRHIDSLGRVVIPREIRKRLDILVNDPIEIGLSDDTILLKKHSSLERNLKIVAKVAKSLRQAIKKPVVVCDTHSIIMAEGCLTYLNQPISERLANIVRNSESFLDEDSDFVVTKDSQDFVRGIAIAPINMYGELYGAILIFSASDKRVGAWDLDCAKMMIDLMSRLVCD